MLSKTDVKIVNKTRSIMADLKSQSYQEDDEFDAGSFSEACANADKALLNVLIVDRFQMDNKSITDEELKGKV